MSSRSLVSLEIPNPILSALTRCGYHTVQDLSAISPESLATDLTISLNAATNVIALSSRATTSTMPSTQSVTQITQCAPKISTKWEPVDKLLQGGIPRGHIIEISGPPGCPKEDLAINIVASFLETIEEVLFIDCQNMISPDGLIQKLGEFLNLPIDYMRLLRHATLMDMTELTVFIHQLPSLLAAHAKVLLSGIFINGYPIIDIAYRHQLYLFPLPVAQFEFVIEESTTRKIQAMFCDDYKHAQCHVLTSQLATKMINPDGTPGTFDSGARGIMLPQLDPSYLPSGRTYQIIVAPNGPSSGYVRLLSSPSLMRGRDQPLSEPYSLRCRTD